MALFAYKTSSFSRRFSFRLFMLIIFIHNLLHSAQIRVSCEKYCYHTFKVRVLKVFFLHYCLHDDTNQSLTMTNLIDLKIVFALIITMSINTLAFKWLELLGFLWLLFIFLFNLIISGNLLLFFFLEYLLLLYAHFSQVI